MRLSFRDNHTSVTPSSHHLGWSGSGSVASTLSTESSLCRMKGTPELGRLPTLEFEWEQNSAWKTLVLTRNQTKILSEKLYFFINSLRTCTAFQKNKSRNAIFMCWLFCFSIFIFICATFPFISISIISLFFKKVTVQIFHLQIHLSTISHFCQCPHFLTAFDSRNTRILFSINKEISLTMARHLWSSCGKCHCRGQWKPPLPWDKWGHTPHNHFQWPRDQTCEGQTWCCLESQSWHLRPHPTGEGTRQNHHGQKYNHSSYNELMLPFRWLVYDGIPHDNHTPFLLSFF